MFLKKTAILLLIMTTITIGATAQIDLHSHAGTAALAVAAIDTLLTPKKGTSQLD